MANIFQQQQSVSLPRSSFSLPFSNKLTCKMGYLTPVFAKNLVPGDKFKIGADLFARLQPLANPALTELDINLAFFAVPMRLLYKDWEKFISPDGSGTPYQQPTFNFGANTIASGSLSDYLGVPIGVNMAKTNILAYKWRAYNLIWNTYFRDENIDSEVANSDAGGPDSTSNRNLLKVRWRKDYFTSCLPSPQMGANMAEFGSEVIWTGNQPVLKEKNGSTWQDADATGLKASAGQWQTNDSTPLAVALDPDGSLKAYTSIGELRRANAVQRFLERQILGGHRYAEYILAHFGVHSSDARLQRPEMIGGGSIAIQVSDIPQTSGASAGTDSSPLGTLGGKATASGFLGTPEEFFATEHCMIMGLMWIRPRADYHQGLEREMTKFDRFDYFTPEFEQIGEMEVLKQEIFLTADKTANETTFGYQSRYAEYKYYPNEIHGDFHDSLIGYTQVRDFANAPSLNSTFLECDPSKRIFAVTDSAVDEVMMQINFDVQAERPMLQFATPSL